MDTRSCTTASPTEEQPAFPTPPVCRQRCVDPSPDYNRTGYTTRHRAEAPRHMMGTRQAPFQEAQPALAPAWAREEAVAVYKPESERAGWRRGLQESPELPSRHCRRDMRFACPRNLSQPECAAGR